MGAWERRMALVWEKETEAGAETRVKRLAVTMHREEEGRVEPRGRAGERAWACVLSVGLGCTLGQLAY